MTDEQRRKQKTKDATICFLFDLIPLAIVILVGILAYYFGIIWCCIVIPLGLIFLKGLI